MLTTWLNHKHSSMGNKRTAIAAAIMFLRVKGIQFGKDDGSLYEAMIAIANKELDKVGLAQVLRRLTYD